MCNVHGGLINLTLDTHRSADQIKNGLVSSLCPSGLPAACIRHVAGHPTFNILQSYCPIKWLCNPSLSTASGSRRREPKPSRRSTRRQTSQLPHTFSRSRHGKSATAPARRPTKLQSQCAAGLARDSHGTSKPSRIVSACVSCWFVQARPRDRQVCLFQALRPARRSW